MSDVTSQTLLPEEFADLEVFAREWALPSSSERYQRRLVGTMEEMQALYDTVAARGEDALAYLDQFDIEDMPEAALRLMWLLASLSVVSFAVNVFKQPVIPDSGAAYLEWTVEPAP